MKTLTHLVCWLVLATTHAHGTVSSSELKNTLEVLRGELNLPSLRAAILDEDGLVAAATGLADVDNGVPMTNDVSMPGGSTGKSFVAATAMLLVEDGVLALSDPVSRYLAGEAWLDDLPGAPGLTVSQLLSHSTGMIDHVNDMDFVLSAAWRRLRGRELLYTPQELISMVTDDGLQFTPGEGYNYTDTGYLVLGLVIEAASDTSYYELLTRRILEPNGLGARPAIAPDMPNVAQGYVAGNLLMTAAGMSGATIEDGIMKLHPLTEWTGGGLMTTPTVLAQFYHQLANGQIVEPETFQQMIEAGYKDPEQTGHYGYGLYINDRVIGHGGWFPGYRTGARHFMDDNLTIAFQTNTDEEFDQGLIMRRLYELVTEKNRG